jgi:hypothetical protein
MTSKVESPSEAPIYHTAGIFITRVVEQLSNGRQRISHSRSHRKGLPPVEMDRDGIGIRAALVANPWLHFWAPHRLAWWIAVLFISGSACFALGSFASNWAQYLPAVFNDSGVINTVFFVGSLFFTSAAWLQLLEAINGDVADIGTSAGTPGRSWCWYAWKPHNAGYSASLIQFIGTVLFNFDTADAMIAGLGWVGEDLLIWTPDVIGSVCFLIASYLMLIEISHRFWSVQPRQVSWWIAVLNMLGSVAFMLAAVHAVFLQSSGEMQWTWGANLFTLIGAAGFFSASYLMIPELFGATGNNDTMMSLSGHAPVEDS